MARRLSEERAEAILEFLRGRGELDEAAARLRLPEVVCVLLDGVGEIAGVNSVFAENVPLIGGRRFWVYRSFLLPAASEAGQAMISATFAALEAEFDPAADGPIGLCLLIADEEEIKQRPEAAWSDPKILYAGYLADGRQVRIAYFAGARVGRGVSTPNPDPVYDEAYRVELFAEQDTVDVQDVIDLWTAEGAVGVEEAHRRVHEVLHVVTHEGGKLVGISSAYLQRDRRLGMDLWFYRLFVASRHRKRHVMAMLALASRDHLENRFTTGQDTRGVGLVYEIENEALRRYYNDAHMLTAGVTFIGENRRGDHVRVRYFPGAVAPGPPR